ncbi:B-cell differentiation antigen CD72 [Tenrec ecaudatus]|uniref:B-cell differentiation antigen CD72 n=1 Tax=Tenrec ecaudatus TaxID=94439 RepID=UPI003F59CE1D
MAEAITYADLRFVKVPLKKSLSTWLGQDPEADEDGELTYENVQGPSAPPLPGPEDLAPCGPGEKAGVQSEQTPVAWSSVTSAAAWRVLPCCASHLHYVLLGLLLACALLAVAATCLGVHYLQVSRQLRQTDAVLGATNSSLRQQLGQQRAQLGRGEDELRAARRELAQSHEAERAAQALHLAAGEQLQACQAEREAAAGSLRAEEARRGLLEQRLGDVREQLKALLACSAETCCPVGWLPQRERCFYFSPTKKTWEESRKDCKSLSSDLASFKESPQLHYSV